MKRLQKDWLTQDWIDLEYKKFVVLAYLQQVRQHFSDNKLYPDLTDLREHYESGLRFQRYKGTLSASFPKELTGIDPETFTWQYTQLMERGDVLQEIDSIMEFALPRFHKTLEEGREVANEIEAGLTLSPVGMLPLNRDEGYLFFHWTAHQETQIYYFCLTLFTGHLEDGRLIRTRYVDSVRKSTDQTFETLKLELIRRQPHIPNPATFMVESSRKMPVQETLLPIASRMLEQRFS